MLNVTTFSHSAVETTADYHGHGDQAITGSPRKQKEWLLFRFIGFASLLWVALGFFEAVNFRLFLSISDFILFAVLLAASFIGRSGRGELATNITFWGSIVIIACSWVFTSSMAAISQDASVLVVASASTMSVILMGIYAVRRYQIDVMFGLAVAANLLWIVHYHFDQVECIHLLVAYSGLLALCYVTARLALKTSRRIEARYETIQTLRDELERAHFAEGRAHAALVDSVAAFCHDVRSPLSAHRLNECH